MNLPAIFSKRAAIGTAVLALGLLAGPLKPDSASAGLITCDLDPYVALSDGSILQMSVHVVDDPADLQNVTYVIHAPAGTRMLGMAFPNDPLSYLESVQFVADSGPGQYSTKTTVSTGAQGVSVTAKTAAVNLLTGAVSLGSTSGTSGNPLNVAVFGH
jgi:hypothetical protein